MDRKVTPVKARRPYDSKRRQLQARQNRDAILEVARRRFLDDGFASTTVAAIAAEVGISVDTVYKSFGGKPGLLRALCDRALAGQEPDSAENRSDALQATERDPRAIIRGWGSLTAEISPQVAPVLLLIRDAAADAEMADLQVEMDRQRLRRMTHNARALADNGHLRTDLSVERAGEIMWTYSSPQLFELLVVMRGWSLEQYSAFIAEAMIAALLPAE